MGIEDLIKDKNAKERAKIKSAEIAKCKIGKYTKGNIDVEIVGDIHAIQVGESHGIEFFAKAWKEKKQLGFAKDGTVETERFRIFNPPVLVDDPNGDIVREWIDEITKEKKHRKLREDPAEAIRRSLIHTIGLVGKENTNIVIGKIGNTSTIFYPTAGTGSPIDGRLVNWDSSGSPWATIRGASSGSYASVTESTFGDWMLQTIVGSSLYRVMGRQMIHFDTSPLDTETITGGTLSIFGNGAGAVQGTPTDADKEVNITSSSPTSDDTLSTSDFGISHYEDTKLCDTGIDGSTWIDDDYNNFSLNSAGIAHIDNAGLSRFALRSIHDINNVDPSWNDKGYRIPYFFADATGTPNDPKLTIDQEEEAAGKSFAQII